MQNIVVILIVIAVVQSSSSVDIGLFFQIPGFCFVIHLREELWDQRKLEKERGYVCLFVIEISFWHILLAEDFFCKISCKIVVVRNSMKWIC